MARLPPPTPWSAPPCPPQAACPPLTVGRWLQLLRWRFAELLEDVHVWGSVWGSVQGRPSGRGLLLTPRLGVAFAALCAHACLAALVTAASPEQVGGLSLRGGGRPNPGPAARPLLTQESARLAAWREVTAGGPRVLRAGATGPGRVCGAGGWASLTATVWEPVPAATAHGSPGVGSPEPLRVCLF